MHKYGAQVSWSRNGADFLKNRYSRGHEWSFDGGITVAASSSPQSVPAPNSVVEAVDPEEALVASASSCHMLWFLALAAKGRFVVDSYIDKAFGIMGRGSDGSLAITRITLRPRVEFSGDNQPTREQLDSLHHAAHAECYIANSLKSEIVVEPA